MLIQAGRTGKDVTSIIAPVCGIATETTMKNITVVLAAIMATSAFAADVNVRGYTRKDGTYVAPSHRSSPDNNPNNNYSSQGRSNPYTGQAGTEPYRAPSPYSQPRQADTFQPMQPMNPYSSPYGTPRR